MLWAIVPSNSENFSNLTVCLRVYSFLNLVTYTYEMTLGILFGQFLIFIELSMYDLCFLIQMEKYLPNFFHYTSLDFPNTYYLREYSLQHYTYLHIQTEMRKVCYDKH